MFESFRSCWGVLVMVVGLLFGGWDVSDGFEQPAVVEPVHVFEGGVLDLVEVTPWSPIVDQFCFVEADHRLVTGSTLSVPQSTTPAPSHHRSRPGPPTGADPNSRSPAARRSPTPTRRWSAPNQQHDDGTPPNQAAGIKTPPLGETPRPLTRTQNTCPPNRGNSEPRITYYRGPPSFGYVSIPDLWMTPPLTFDGFPNSPPISEEPVK